MSKAKPVHAFYCFEALYTYLNSQPTKSRYRDSDLEADLGSKLIFQDQFENEEYPLFVTWTSSLDESGEDMLRGCIGNFSPLPLHEGLKDYALVSALQDTRFPPIDLAELDELSCSVSLLVNFEKGNDYLDWEVNKHGIRIKFHDSQGNQYGGTYLPEIAQEQGWSKEETINSLIRKAGYRGKSEADLLDGIKLTRYQSHKVKVSYQQFMDSLA